MIQRIQTVYLAIASLLTGLLLYGPIVKLVGAGGEDYRLLYKGIYSFDNITPVLIEKSLPLAILIIVSAILFILTIFLFRRRKLQLRLSVFATLLSIGNLLLILFYTFYTGNKLGTEYIFNIKMVFPLGAAIMGYLAFRGILKDEMLIRSYDRIR